MTAPLKVLIVAEHASARFGGEAALPLHYFRVLERRGVPVWLVTHARTRDELTALYPSSDRIFYIEDTAWHRAMWRIGDRLPASIAYITTGFLSRLSTQRAQRRVAKRLVRIYGIDVIHQPMPVSPREPSLLHGFGVPVVIGPMNGGMDYPPAFDSQRAGISQWLVGLGRMAATAMNALIPGKRRAATLLVANARTRSALPANLGAHVVELVENGVDLGLWRGAARAGGSRNDDTVFAFMGRLVDWKAVDILIHAFAIARTRSPMRLWVLGDGPQREALEALARRLDVSVGAPGDRSAVHFAGWLPQQTCAARLSAADCLVLPSLLECGGAVVLEAMALGRPVIATAWGGPLDYLDPSCGVLVPPRSRQGLIDGFAEAMATLARHSEEREQMGARALAKVVREFDWELKVDRIIAVYHDAIARSAKQAKAAMGH